MPLLTLQDLTPAAFAPYGHAYPLREGAGRPINAGTTERMDLPAGLDLAEGGAAPLLAVFHARAQQATGPWVELERHRLGSQTFLPLAPVPWIVLVALGDDAPDPGTLAAFRADGRLGLTLSRGTWHHPLVALADGAFLVLERGAAADDCEVVHLADPVTLRG